MEKIARYSKMLKGRIIVLYVCIPTRSGHNTCMMESFSKRRYITVKLHYCRSNVPYSVYVQEAVVQWVRIQLDWRRMHAMPQRQLDPHTMSTAWRYEQSQFAIPDNLTVGCI